MVNKWKKALFSAALGMLCSAVFGIILFRLTGHSPYLAIIGLGAGMGFSISGVLDTQGLAGPSNCKS